MFNKNPYVRGGIGMPSVLIAAAWIGIWFLWPAPPGDGVLKIAPQAKVIFVNADDLALHRSPMLFARTPLTQWITREESLSEDGGGGILTGYARFLERGYSGTENMVPFRKNMGSEQRFGLGAEYEPRFRMEPVFTDAGARVPVLRVQPVGGLAERGFRMPEIAAEPLKKSGSGWTIQLYVEADEDGAPRHVFLESGSGDRAMDALVLRTVRMGKVLEPGKACEGRLIINYGSP